MARQEFTNLIVSSNLGRLIGDQLFVLIEQLSDVCSLARQYGRRVEYCAAASDAVSVRVL